MLYIEPGVFFLCAFLLLMLPLKWVLGAILAALIHELCHLVAVQLMGGKISRICVGSGGTRIDGDLSDNKKELLAILAGPAGSLFLAFLFRSIPELAVCGGIQGLYNLLPVWPLDGGRAVSLMWPEYAVRVETVTYALLFLGGVYAFLRWKTGFWILLTMLVLASGQISRKIPCKQGHFGVQ